MIFFHGGSRRQMLLGWHYSYYYHNAYAMNQYLASQGYVVLSVNYRSGIGYGLDFREALELRRRGRREFNDVMGAGLYLKRRPDVDPRAHRALGRLVRRLPHRDGPGARVGPLRRRRGHPRRARLERGHPELRARLPAREPAGRRAARLRVLAAWPPSTGWRSPVLLIHGDDDRNVPFTQSVMLAEALRERGVPFEELVFPDEVHDFLTHAHWLAAYRAAADFFDRKLASRAGTPR